MLAGCSQTPLPPKVVTITKEVPKLPPIHLLNDCLASQPSFQTNGDLLRFAIQSHNQNVLCSLDKAALREWREKYEQHN
ncbi:Rz1-like lysis system protein LysC [Pseudoalteromonas ruthenica]|uniref:Rz1-like lysis system protein LysC n=1 Tax=Pseudoalteromonas ruthenica TaxID=151081 RepID=UPI001BB10EE2